MQEKVKILGVEIDNITLDEAGNITKNLIENSNKSCELIVAPNVEFIMQAQKDEYFFNILKTAKLATPDSKGVEIAAKKQGKPLKQRIPGQDYFRKILELSEKYGWTIYILGGKDDTAEKATKNIKKIYPSVKIVGVHEGFFEKDSEEDVIKEINKLTPNILFVAMGAPRQEKWIYDHRSELKVDIAAGQGGTLDYESGNVKRAPKWMQRAGIEWLWRLILQPTRIKRMIVLPIYLFKITFTKDMEKSVYEKSKKGRY